MMHGAGSPSWGQWSVGDGQVGHILYAGKTGERVGACAGDGSARGTFAFGHKQIVHRFGSGIRLVGHDLSVGEYDGTVGVGGGHRIVRDHDDGLAKLVDRTLQEAEHFGAGNGVEVAGRLVSEHQLRLGNQRAGDGHALLLATGQFIRSVVQALLQSQGIDEQVEPGVVGLVSGESQWHEDVLFGGEHGQQVEALEDEADLVAT